MVEETRVVINNDIRIMKGNPTTKEDTQKNDYVKSITMGYSRTEIYQSQEQVIGAMWKK
jgi:hypothetical protein